MLLQHSDEHSLSKCKPSRWRAKIEFMSLPRFPAIFSLLFGASGTISIPEHHTSTAFWLDVPLHLAGFHFEQLRLSPRGDCLVGVDVTDKAFVKIGLAKLPGKRRSVFEESQVVEELTSKGAVSCPEFIGRGKLLAEQLPAHARPDSTGELDYFISRYVKSTRTCTISDFLLALTEQQKLGWFQGDIKPSNMRLDPETGSLVFVDYDQAVELSKEVVLLDNISFLNWTFGQELERFGQLDWLRHFPSWLSVKHLHRQYRGSALNLSQTSMYLKQRTTNTKAGVYHTVSNDRVFADGVRTLDDRKGILDRIPLSRGERVLDVGCNVGLLSHYLFDRGCEVTGFELDAPIVAAARSIANILGKKIEFEAVDIDNYIWDREFDTIMLFSIFHHTKHMSDNGRRIASACRRVVIECRLVEKGKKPSPSTLAWEESSSWNFSSLDELYVGLEDFFPGFLVTENFGSVDKDRYIIEMQRS